MAQANAEDRNLRRFHERADFNISAAHLADFMEENIYGPEPFLCNRWGPPGRY